MNEELQKKAEDFIIERYKIAKCYREDNAETREYMRIDVHSQYEEEYQLYLAATKELQEEIAELKEQIVDLKDYVLKVSKFLHNNYNVRPDNLAYKERDVLLIKELKLFEKWEIKEK